MRGFVLKWKYIVPPKPFGLFSARVAHNFLLLKGIFSWNVPTVAIYWWKCDRAGVRHPICRPKFMVFLDSQILSGIYFYHWHLINCKISYLIPILSTDFFAILPYMLKTGNNEKYGFKWPILGPFFALIQKITVIFEIICYFLLSFIHLDKIRPNSHEF